MPLDSFMKPLSAERYSYFISQLGLINISMQIDLALELETNDP